MPCGRLAGGALGDWGPWPVQGIGTPGSRGLGPKLLALSSVTSGEVPLPRPGRAGLGAPSPPPPLPRKEGL